MFLSNPNYSESSSGIRSFMSKLPKETFKIQSLKKKTCNTQIFFLKVLWVTKKKKKKKKTKYEKSPGAVYQEGVLAFCWRGRKEKKKKKKKKKAPTDERGEKNTQTNKKKQLHAARNLNTCSVPVVEPDWMMACVEREKWKSSILSLNSSRCSRALGPLSRSHSNHLVPLCQKKEKKKKKAQKLKTPRLEDEPKKNVK